LCQKELGDFLSGTRTIPILKALTAVLFWGGSFIATKVALREASPVTIIWLRFAVGLIVIGVAVKFRREFALVTLREFLYFSFLGFLGITFHQWLQSTGLITAQATTTAWIITTTPVFIAILGWFVLREKLRGQQIAGIGLAALGVLLVVSQGNLKSVMGGHFGTYGDFLITVSALNWAVFAVLSRKSLEQHPAALSMFYVILTGWIFISLLFLYNGGPKEVNHFTVQGWFALTFLGIFCSGIAYIFWFDALKSIPASQVGAFLYLEPLVTMAIASIVLKEKLIFPMFIGGAVIVAGVWMVTRPAKNSTEVGS
jgi:drug/metabolite transporter (DMT)-like permease